MAKLQPAVRKDRKEIMIDEVFRTMDALTEQMDIGGQFFTDDEYRKLCEKLRQFGHIVTLYHGDGE